MTTKEVENLQFDANKYYLNYLLDRSSSIQQAEELLEISKHLPMRQEDLQDFENDLYFRINELPVL